MDDKLRRRLRKLGVVKGLAALQSADTRQDSQSDDAAGASDGNSVPGEDDRGTDVSHQRSRTRVLPGHEVRNGAGTFWLDRRVYSADHVHGRYSLGSLSLVSESALALFEAADLGPRPAFVDTETTGLAGGAGTLAFLVGAGIWNGDALTLHLVFMRQPEEEPAALSYLTEVLSEATGLVTFNGRGFDLPILQTRYILNRMAPVCLARPHLDLLWVARQLWRDHLPSRRLGELERHILDIARSDEDLPSALIPDFYRQYLETGDPTQMRRIFYHNEIDILSLVTLLVHVTRMVDAPREMNLAPAEWAGLGRVYDRVGAEDEAMAAWRVALSGELGELDSACAARLWREIGLRHKRREAWDRAFESWNAWIRAEPWAIDPLVEQAKYYEWTVRDFAAALACTERAIKRAGAAPRSLQRYKVLAELRHRRNRLLDKLERQESSGEST